MWVGCGLEGDVCVVVCAEDGGDGACEWEGWKKYKSGMA